MTYADAFAADHWTLPARERLRDVGWSWRPSNWVVDPLERAMLVAVCVLGGVLLWVLASQQPARGATTQDSCVVTAVDEARDFARVLGDERFVPMSFAARACR